MDPAGGVNADVIFIWFSPERFDQLSRVGPGPGWLRWRARLCTRRGYHWWDRRSPSRRTTLCAGGYRRAGRSSQSARRGPVTPSQPAGPRACTGTRRGAGPIPPARYRSGPILSCQAGPYDSADGRATSVRSTVFQPPRTGRCHVLRGCSHEPAAAERAGRYGACASCLPGCLGIASAAQA